MKVISIITISSLSLFLVIINYVVCSCDRLDTRFDEIRHGLIIGFVAVLRITESTSAWDQELVLLGE